MPLRPALFVLCVVIVHATAASVRPAEPAARPNLLLIIADDLGYADLGVQGCADVPTPHIDALATGGARFTAAYVTCPVCSPSRAGMLTGRYQERFGHEFNSGPAQAAAKTFGLPENEKTLADRLRDAGYTTGLIGKWHLGYRPELHPQKRGFDFFYGFVGGAHSYVRTGAQGPNPIVRGTEKVAEIDYTTEAFGREAVGFVGANRARPWFLVVSFNAVHGPLQAPAKYLARFGGIADAKRRTYAAMLSALDDATGAMVEAVRASGRERDTLVVFISDNGGPTASTTSSNHPFRGYKNEVWEGGIRIPCLVRWPGRIRAGQTIAGPVSSLDLAPTFFASAGLAAPREFEGIDLLPRLTGQTDSLPERPLLWRYGSQRAVRLGRWKLVDFGSGPMLFDLEADPGEQRDRAGAQPEIVRKLEAAYAAWNRGNVPPRWANPEPLPTLALASP